jgi:predicted enzyme related to lactoylglutathione lyase
MDDETMRPFAFVLAVRDLEASATYLRDRLGFALGWEEMTGWRLLTRGSVRLMLGHCPDAVPARETGDHSWFGYLQVDDIDALHAEFAESGAIIVNPPSDRPHGMREMVVALPEGHRLMMAQALD